MRRKVSGLVVVVSQLLMVGLFFVNAFSGNIKVEKYVSTIHNENLNKIASSVSMLFEEEIPVYEVVDSNVLEELPSIDQAKEEVVEVKKENKVESTPLVSIDSTKYVNKESTGFKVSEGNKEYNLTDDEFDVVVAVVAGEYGENLDDALAVVSVILNRCDTDSWAKWAGTSPYDQVVKKGQFEVYFKGYYKTYMPGGSKYGSTKYNVAKQAVIDGLNGIRNNKYLGFRSWSSKGYSDKYIVAGGNRYGYN